MINTSTYVVKVCRPGADAETCRYLTMSHDGWECARGSGALEAHIESLVKQGRPGDLETKDLSCS
jgi:hypothetical protein